MTFHPVAWPSRPADPIPPPDIHGAVVDAGRRLLAVTSFN